MKYFDFQSAFVGNLHDVMTYGTRVSPRGLGTRELLMHSFTVLNPQKRAIVSAARAGNPIAQVAETLWVLAGRNDLSWLEEYIPQCRKWSDDGETWRAGYGPRLRRWPQVYGDVRHDEYNYIDQIRQVYDKLRQDPDTRQAVITLWDPAEDWVEDSLDYPCNNWLHFIIRDNRLHLNVSIRSNDAVYGFSHADFFTWSVLQQAMASWLGIDIGLMQWNATSFHVYERHYEKAEDIVDEWNIHRELQQFNNHFHPLQMYNDYDDFHNSLHTLLEAEQAMRNGEKLSAATVGDINEFTTFSMLALWLHYALKHNWDDSEVADVLHTIEHVDLGVAIMHYALRKRPSLAELLTDSQAFQFLRSVGFVS